VAELAVRDLFREGRYMWRDVELEAERFGLAFRKPSSFPRNSVPALRLALFGVVECGDGSSSSEFC
jgi:2-hydroxychromene-2-carboxylate isomerase